MISPRLEAARYAATRDHIRFIRAWAESLGAETRAKVDGALALMIDLHLDQADRPGPQPYVEHAAEVARHVIDWTVPTSPDAVMAACLHDAVEDQAPKLAGRSDRPPHELRAQALEQLAGRLGERVAALVARVTNPDIDALVTARFGAIEGAERRARANEIYTEHVVEVFEREPEAAAIKLGDFGSNAFRIDRVETSTEAGRQRKAKLLQKYAGTMRYLLTYFDALPPTHPLHSHRVALRERVRAVWSAEYEGRVEPG